MSNYILCKESKKTPFFARTMSGHVSFVDPLCDGFTDDGIPVPVIFDNITDIYKNITGDYNQIVKVSTLLFAREVFVLDDKKL